MIVDVEIDSGLQDFRNGQTEAIRMIRSVMPSSVKIRWRSGTDTYHHFDVICSKDEMVALSIIAKSISLDLQEEMLNKIASMKNQIEILTAEIKQLESITYE